MATALEWAQNVSPSPLIPGSTAGKAQKEHLSLPHEGSRAASEPHPVKSSAAGPHHPAHLNPLSEEEAAWICLVLLSQERGCFILALPSSFGPQALTRWPHSYLTCGTAPGPETSPAGALPWLLSLLSWTQSQTCHLGWRWWTDFF